MIRARFSPKAVRDLDEHCGHIAADNPEAAERVRRTILDAADLLAQHRELGRRIRKAEPRHEQIRWFVVPKFRNRPRCAFKPPPLLPLISKAEGRMKRRFQKL